MGSSSQDLFGELRIFFAISISETTEMFENCSPLKGASWTTLSFVGGTWSWLYHYDGSTTSVFSPIKAGPINIIFTDRHQVNVL
jgi:hypothetical protein